MKSSLRLALVVLFACSTLATAQNTRFVLKIHPSDTPASPLILAPGDTVQFTAKAYEATSGGLIEVQIDALAWSVEPATFGSITGSGFFTASSQNSTPRGQVKATATVGSVTLQGAVNVMLGHSQGEYTFTGTVSSAQGPIVHAEVSVMSVSMLPFMVTGKTDAQGHYSIKVPGGEYIVRAAAQGFVPEYYDNVYDQSQAKKFITDPNNTTISGIDFLLGQGGRIEGHVSDAATNVAIKNARVFLHTNVTRLPPSGANMWHAVTDAQGYYQITGLPDGDYYVSAEAQDYHMQYYDGETDPTLADKVTITNAGTASGIDFSLNERQPDPVYSIKGTVYDANNNPIADAIVFGEMVGGPMLHWLQARTAQDGSYELKAPSGTFMVWANAPGYIVEYYNEKSDASQADHITLSATTPSATGVDFTLGTGGSISGTVIDATTNQPLQGVYVHAFSDRTTTGNPNGAGNHSVTDAQGNYRITGLPTADYIVRARADHHGEQYYDGVTDISLATKVGVLDGQETQDIDFAMYQLPGISGRVTDAATGAPIGHAIVVLTAPNARVFGYTDAQGHYTVTTHPGSYTVQCTAQGYVPEWYDNVTDITQATVVTLTQTGTVTGIDFALDGFNGSIAGTVKDASGNPIADVVVSAWGHGNPSTTNAHGRYGKAISAADGSYLIAGLMPDDYIVRAVASNYVPEFYDNKNDVMSADKVTVANTAVTGIDFSLDTGGSISGTVTDEDTGDPLAHAVVFVRSLTHRFERGARTDAHGDYSVAGLPSGDYSVYAAAAGYAGEYYNPTASGPGIVSVTAPGAVTDIDFSLDAVPIGPRRYTGAVVARGGGLPQHVLVEAINPETGARISTTTDNRGSFDFHAWDNAIVRTRALGFVGMYAGNTMQWKESRWNGFAGGMTFTLDPMASFGMAEVRGTVTETGSGDPLTGAWVYGVDAAGQVYFAVTGPDGGYLIENTPNGSLDLMVSEVQFDITEGLAQVENARGTADISAQRSTVSAVDEDPAVPSAVRLYQNYPNPFNPATTLRFDLPERTVATLKVFNLLGQEVATLVHGIQDSGSHVINFTADDLPTGLYLYRLEANGVTLTRRMTLMK